jgi:hypothetical protein
MRNLLMLFFLIGCDAGSKHDAPCPSAQPQNGDSCGFHALCYYFDACTHDSTGVMAACENGKVSIAYDEVAALCGKVPPQDGDPCPCGAGGRQSDCSFSFKEGGSLAATCDPMTLKWKVTRPATCTVVSG